MLFSAYVAAFAATAASGVIASTTSEAKLPGQELRLIKTSEADPGRWVSEAEKLSKYVAKQRHFIDITDIQDPEVLRLLSTPQEEEEANVAARAITYPTSMTHVAEANALIANVNNAGPQSWLQTLTNYNNRYYRSTTGTQAGTWLYNQVRSIASANSAIVVSQFTHSYNQPSIIARIPGTSPSLIIVGAHYDSTAGSATARAPGADDDGSGVVNTMEALRILANAKFKPKNTLEFHFYSGEEGGLLGSAAIFANYKAAQKTILGFVNQDMTGYSPSGRVAVYTDYGDSSFIAYVRRVVQQYTGLASTSDRCGYGCSDHASAYSNGFPAAYVCDEVMATASPYIHSSRDTYATIMWPAILRHSKFTVGFLVEASYL